MPTNLTNDYIRGLVDGEGSFGFESSQIFMSDGRVGKRKIPSFRIQMHERDELLLWSIKNALGLRNKIYKYGPYQRDGIKRGKQVVLAVRDLGQLKNIIIPLFYGRLIGHKRNQFIVWLEKIGTDPEVAEFYRILYHLHLTGYFKRELSKGGLFEEFVN